MGFSGAKCYFVFLFFFVFCVLLLKNKSTLYIYELTD